MKAFTLLLFLNLFASSYDYEFNVLKYGGGGDWYEGLVGAKNLIQYINKEIKIDINPSPNVVSPSDSDFLNKKFLYTTGHGNITLSVYEKKQMREYLYKGGFWYVNDDYGLDVSFQKLIKEILPNLSFLTLSPDHKIFNIYYSFNEGTPKIHKHDGGPPEISAIYYKNRMIVLYTKNTDIGDGWAPYQVHKDPEELRTKALQFGANIIIYSMTH